MLRQVGTNAVLRDNPLGPVGRLVHDGIARIKALGADVVLIDPQFAPMVIAKADAEDMVNRADPGNLDRTTGGVSADSGHAVPGESGDTMSKCPARSRAGGSTVWMVGGAAAARIRCSNATLEREHSPRQINEMIKTRMERAAAVVA